MYTLLKKRNGGIQVIQEGNLLGRVQMINLLIWREEKDTSFGEFVVKENKFKLKFTYNQFDKDPVVVTGDQIEVDLHFRSGYKIQWIPSNIAIQEESSAINCKISFDGKQLKNIQRLTYKCTGIESFSNLNLTLRLCDV